MEAHTQSGQRSLNFRNANWNLALGGEEHRYLAGKLLVVQSGLVKGILTGS